MRAPVFHPKGEYLRALAPSLSRNIHCASCGLLVRTKGENLQGWFETGKGGHCLGCFAFLYDLDERNGDVGAWNIQMVMV